jgi:predicted branched-subunit amino acid permease
VAGDPSIWGLDAAAAAAFLGLVWPRLKNLQSNLIAVLAIVFTLVLVPVLQSGIPVIIGAPIAVALIYVLKRTKFAKYLQVAHDD